jgi:polyisoprenoid-binding protein YceI
MTRRMNMGALAAIALLLPLRAGAQATIPKGTVLHGTLSFDGHSTLGAFTGTTATVQGEIHGGPELTAIRGSVEAPVATLKTANDHRDRDLRSSMETDKFPTMKYEVTGVTPGPVVGDIQQVTLDGAFTVHGVTRPEQLTARLYRAPGTVRITTSLQMNLKDYRIGGLTKMLGVLRMDEMIEVHVDVTFGAASP